MLLAFGVVATLAVLILSKPSILGLYSDLAHYGVLGPLLGVTTCGRFWELLNSLITLDLFPVCNDLKEET